MNLDEQTTKLIREHLRLSVIIDDLKKTLESLKVERISLKGLHEMMTKQLGQHMTDRQRVVRDELRKSGVSTWIEDQGDIVYAHVAIRGVKERFGVKRVILDEEIQLMMDNMAEENRRRPSTYTPTPISW